MKVPQNHAEALKVQNFSIEYLTKRMRKIQVEDRVERGVIANTISHAYYMGYRHVKTEPIHTSPMFKFLFQKIYQTKWKLALDFYLKGQGFDEYHRKIIGKYFKEAFKDGVYSATWSGEATSNH